MACLGRAERLIAISFLFSMLLPAVALAQIEYTWAKLEPGSFNTDLNWNPVGVPGPLDTAKFSEHGSNTVTFSTGVFNFLLLIDHGMPTFELAGNAYVPEGVIVGDDPGDVAVLTLLDGTVSVASPVNSRVRIGKDEGSDGTLTVSTNATFTSAVTLLVGDAGSGTLLLENGGIASTDAGVPTFIADEPGSSGTLTVSGTGSSWTANGNVLLGNGGSGQVNILGGGTGSVAMAVRIGDDAGSDGNLIVDGTGSTLDITGETIVGNFSPGSASVTNGGVLTTTLARIADELDSTGTLTVDGAGSEWNNSGAVLVGDEGAATLTVTNGAEVSALSFTINTLSSLLGNGLVKGDVTSSGTVSPDGLGELNFQGNYIQDGNGSLDIQLAALDSDRLSVSGSATLAGTLNVSFADGAAPAGEIAILTATSISGTFDQVNLPAGTFLTYLANSVVITTEPRLTVTKIVQNDDGGLLGVADFEIMIDGGSVTSGVANVVSAGEHTVSETPVAGYTGVIGGDCAPDGKVSVAVGEARVCTITNTDDQPTLTVTKIVVNSEFGELEVEDFTIMIDGVPVTSGVPYEVNAGLRTVSELPETNYTGVFGGDCAPNGAVSVALGQSRSCTITNTAQEPAIFMDGFE